ncbi:MAG: hypothetical protein ACKKMS_03270 [Candidatus Nealsonbacteria bacterium]
MFNFLSKLIFFWKKPKIIIITGQGKDCAAKAIFQVLRQHFKIGRLTNFPHSLNFGQILSKEILIFEPKIEKAENFKFLIKTSQLPILLVTHIGDIPFDKDFFAGDKEKTKEIRKLARILPSQGYLILNFDDETVREIKDETNLKDYNPPTILPPRRAPITFGFQERADFRASDIRLNNGTNFKINYKGNIVPIWLEKLFGKEQIYASLSAISIGVIFDLNLVEISQLLKNYQGIAGNKE